MPEAMTDPALIRKTFEPSEVNYTPGERSFIPWISTETVDREGDVVVARGIDFKGFVEDNPCVMAFHDYGRWPIGRCEWIKVKQANGFAGIYGKAVIDEDPDSEVVWKKIHRRTARGVSTGSTPPADLGRGEWGPPTADELKKTPNWTGAKRIVRRCTMIEFSVVPIPMN